MTDKEHFIMESKMFSIYSTNIKDWKPSEIKKPFTIKSLLERVYFLEEQIDKMKCCGNCKHMDFLEPNYCMKGIYREKQYVCEKWELEGWNHDQKI